MRAPVAGAGVYCGSPGQRKATCSPPVRTGGLKMKAFIFLVAGAALVGCASAPSAGNVNSLFADARFTAPSEPVSGGDIFALDGPMRSYLTHQIAGYVRNHGPRRGLLYALRDDFRIEYDADRTRNAEQAFASRSGNCLSLAIMTGAFAKQMGIPVTYREVYGFDSWSRSDGLTFHSGHVNLVLGPLPPDGWEHIRANPPLIVDFLPPQEAAAMTAREIPEQMIVAMYLNNRAAEIMAGGDVDRAYWWARAAIRADPSFLGAYNTLGVIYARHGDLSEAEQALRYALTREPESVDVLSNLIQLFEAESRTAEAQVLKKRLAGIEPYPPFYFFDRGKAAMAKGDYRSAVELFRKELARLPYNDEVHFALAVAELRLGNLGGARGQLELALDNSTSGQRHAIYAAKLEHLKALSVN
ncbi:MAG: tetratricopeptide repeat protein [Gammaproteobacteria bacterium]|nr:tetratricopeptide repeat protein [Gammaproteobacteria bacterium]